MRDPYWGLVTMIVDADTVLKEAGLTDAASGVRFVLRRNDGLGAQGEIFLGDPKVFESSPYKIDVQIPNSSWTLAALLGTEADRFSPRLWLFRTTGVLLAFSTAALVYF